MPVAPLDSLIVPVMLVITLSVLAVGRMAAVAPAGFFVSGPREKALAFRDIL